MLKGIEVDDASLSVNLLKKVGPEKRTLPDF